jgi:hypothetical protein
MKIADILEMHESLLTAIDKAGGSPSGYSGTALSEMSALDLMIRLAPNKVRFCHVGKLKSQQSGECAPRHQKSLNQKT